MKMAGAPLGKGPISVCGSRKPSPTVVAMISTRISPAVMVGPFACGASADTCLIVSSICIRLPPFRWVQTPDVPALLFSGYQLKFTRVKIFFDDIFVAMPQVKRIMKLFLMTLSTLKQQVIAVYPRVLTSQSIFGC
ncbi:conserved hypothetical protein [Agrobacterium tumefaciens str. B6]|uniref:Uncharacterized protein n=1 Tax=Agrobacterium tumefaciens str. B6 TaxID=1183423 RepID=A0A822V3V1_AGRTU|nr:conserved hypothetical protein [Agrobacterium tumefaciens str. B6]